MGLIHIPPPRAILAQIGHIVSSALICIHLLDSFFCVRITTDLFILLIVVYLFCLWIKSQLLFVPFALVTPFDSLSLLIPPFLLSHFAGSCFPHRSADGLDTHCCFSLRQWCDVREASVCWCAYVIFQHGLDLVTFPQTHSISPSSSPTKYPSPSVLLLRFSDTTELHNTFLTYWLQP